MKIRWKYLIFFILIAVVFISCEDTKDLESLKRDVNNLKNQVNKIFTETRIAAEENKKFIEKAINNIDNYNLSYKELDKSAGGNYEWFNDYIYHRSKDIGKGTIAYLKFKDDEGNAAHLDRALKKVKLLELLEDDLIQKNADLEYSPPFNYFTDDFIQYTYPYFNFVQTAPPQGLQRELVYTFSFFSTTIPENNPGKKPVWSNDAFVSMGGNGYLWTVSVPAFNKDGAYEGVSTKDIFVYEIRNVLKEYDEKNIMFLGAETPVLGLTKSIKDIVKVQDLAEFDYLKLMRNNAFVADEYKLIHDQHPAGIQKLGHSVRAGKSKFNIILSGKKYTAVVSKISEVDFYVVGLLPLNPK